MCPNENVGMSIVEKVLRTTPRQSTRKKQKFSGGFRGVSALETEVTVSVEVDAVSD